MVTIHIQLFLSIALWIIITVTLMRILFKMPHVIIYRHNQLKSLCWIDIFCVFNAGLRSLIHSASEVFPFHLLLWKFLSIILNSMVLIFLCDFSIVCFKTYDVWSVPLWSFILSVIQWAPCPTKCHSSVQSQFCFWH